MGQHESICLQDEERERELSVLMCERLRKLLMLRFDQIGMTSLQLFQLHPEHYPLKFRLDWLPSRSELNSLEFELHLVNVRDKLNSSLYQVMKEEQQ